MEKSKYVIFLDIDGTLTCRQPMPSDAVAEAIARAKRAGHKIILNTGRGRGNVYEPMLEKIQPDGIICAMGQYIELEGKVVRAAHLTKEQAQLVLLLAEQKGYGGYIEGISKIYGVRGGDCSGWDFDIGSVPEAKPAYQNDLLKLSLMGQADEETLNKLSKHFIIYQHPTYFESSLKGYNKAKGMLDVLDILGWPKEKSIAVGDSTNDTDMIMAAEIGVAMGNATEALKSVADYITKSNSEDGVAYALEQLLNI